MFTLEELMEQMLHKMEIDDIISVLEVSAEDILDHFEHRVADNYEKILEEME